SRRGQAAALSADTVSRAAAPPSYPHAEDEPGRPFKDPNLKLVVLDAMREAKLIDLGSPKQLAEHVLGKPVDLTREGHRLIRPVYDYLARYPVTQRELDAVEQLVFDGGDAIYPYIYFFWDGTTSDFDVVSLEGIESLRNLRRFNSIALLRDTDLSRLARLSKLEAVDLSLDHYRNSEALLDLPNLRQVAFFSGSIPAGVWLKLVEKGVQVKVNK
ncbi:MAG: hypothetical protein JO163_11660, partial [Methylobacteriaceae bacterium]|nr:hypothetical protein [Methylobacteriaceae bacterium]